ncbi:hypothetical protein BC826DRAFT_1050755 [Russula brevipes]|nr:hypothetical protein BC826DRAFT_1050755 [Russula brevipes]
MTPDRVGQSRGSARALSTWVDVRFAPSTHSAPSVLVSVSNFTTPIMDCYRSTRELSCLDEWLYVFVYRPRYRRSPQEKIA